MPSEFQKSYDVILNELKQAMDTINLEDIIFLMASLKSAEKVFFAGVGRVFLSLQAMAKRWAHLGINAHVVGQITEPAISEKDLLIVASGSGETFFPLGTAKKAKSFGASVIHIGVNPNSSMNEFSDRFIQIRSNSRYGLEGEVKSQQPMTSLFEQSLLILGDSVALMLIQKYKIDTKKLWQYHANLE